MIVLIAFTGCQNNGYGGYPPIIIGGDPSGSQSVSPSVVSEALSMDRIIEAMTATDHEEQGIFVNYSVVNDPQTQTRIATFSAGDDPVSTANTAIRIRADITFKGFVSGNATLYGTMVLYFNATQSDSTATISGYEVESSNVDVKAGNATSTVNASGLTGTIASATASVTTTGTGTEVSVSPITEGITTSITGSFTIGNETVSKAEADEVVSGGMGTEVSPYEISNLEEFGKMFDFPNGTYFKLTSDIHIPAETYYSDMFMSHLDGNNHSIIIDGQMPLNLFENAEYSLFSSLGIGSFKNLKYYPTGLKALSYNIANNGTFTFENVDIYGSMLGADTNVGAYTLFVGYNSTVLFKDCDNYADIIDEEGGRHYGAAFIGGYVYVDTNGNGPASVKFENCHNYGDIFFGDSASVFLGNTNNLSKITQNTDFFVVDDQCQNHGTVSAIEKVGWKNWDDSENLSQHGGTFAVYGTDDRINEFHVYKDGTFAYAPEVSSDVILSFSVRANSVFSGVGNRQHSFVIDVNRTGNKLPITTVANQSGYETGDLILNEDDQTYSLNINPGDYEGFGSGAFTSFDPLWYYVIIRDASTGDIVGAACTKTLEEKI